ncbi:protein kinase [Actinoplanes sp. TBRC 11911]|uniref:serine/threonine-protein kinase n=1 Tax=Actinoplanes sp. TBRC 11911 TaxID=2729386 RepID=UPI00145D7025|nr:serine/threonine-protein kinase [Actinoplanes sp. TBRC 11911]NMO54590.1 protein kinase [Actinoplanes sp. TBRC 11911]
MSDKPRELLAGRYRLGRPLGEGAMGRVWEARDELLGRAVAIKEIAPNGLTTVVLGDLRRRAIREARAIAQVSHPNVVRVFDVVTEDDVPWIVMELVRSRSLFTVVSEEGPIDPRRAAGLGLQVLAGLRAAHEAGILHRDVKPANVLVTADGRAVLTDFGLAALAGDATMTSTGVVIGSPSYLAPELAQDEPAGPASDLWSLGATLFAVVEGRPPYSKSSPMATLAALMVDPAPVPRRAGVLTPALRALLTKDPQERAGGDEAEKLLRDAADGVTQPGPRVASGAQPSPAGARPHTVGPPESTASRSRKRALLLAAGVAVIAAIAAAAVVVTRQGSPDTVVVEALSSAPENAINSVKSPVAGQTPSAKPSVSAPASIRPPSQAASNPAATTTTRPPVTKAPPVVKPSTHTLAAAFNNVAITSDSQTTAGNFDGGGATYSAQAFASAGATPGTTVTVGGVGLKWPAGAGTGRKDNVIAAGQTVGVPGSGRRLAFLVAASYGAAAGSGRITYTDGTTQAYTLSAPDWDDTENAAVAVIAPYQNRSGDGRYEQPAAVFGVSVALTAGKTVASVRLPSAGAVPVQEGTTTMHIFAAGVG